jgi:hypothetical protein
MFPNTLVEEFQVSSYSKFEGLGRVTLVSSAISLFEARFALRTLKTQQNRKEGLRENIPPPPYFPSVTSSTIAFATSSAEILFSIV